MLSIGPEETATRRLNLAQAFNPLGTNIGVLLAATLILPKLADPVNMSSLTPEQLHEIRAAELGAVMGPYIGLGCLLVAIGIVIALASNTPRRRLVRAVAATVIAIVVGAAIWALFIWKLHLWLIGVAPIPM